MAKLSAHGQEIGRLYKTTSVFAYFTDGKVLANQGFGWKLHAKVKPGLDPVSVFQSAQQRQTEFIAARPALAAYRKELRAMAGIGKAWKLHAAIQIMPDDCDGVWSECCDGYGDNVSADIDEVSELCRLYRVAAEESKSLKASQTQ
jgi:hypothetical protein